MRARPIFPLLLSFGLVLLLAALLFWGTSVAPSSVSADSLAWSELAGLTGGSARALAINPTYPNDQTVLAGGGVDAGHASMFGLGLFRSLDGGLTWADHAGPPNGALLDAAFSPNWQSDGFAVAGFYQGVWTTKDHGASWQKLSDVNDGTPPGFVAAVAVNTTVTGTHALLAGGPYGGVYYSVDDGDSWVWNGDPGAIYRLRFHPTLPGVALAAAGNGLWRSTDYGVQWTRVTTTTSVYDVAFADNGSAVATFDGLAWRSTDDGVTWQPLSGTPIERLDVLGLSPDGGTVLAAVDTRLYRYDLGAGEFVTVTTQPALSHIWRIVFSPAFAADQTVLVGTNDGVWRSSNGGQTLVRSAGFAPLKVFSMAAAGNALAGDLYVGTDYGVWRRSGATWEPLNAGIGFGSPIPINSVALSPAYAQDQTVFAAGGDYAGLGGWVYRSTDRGQSWRRLFGTEYISQIAVSPNYAADHRLYLVAQQQVWRSDDGGETATAQHSAQALALSPSFGQDQTLVAVGNGVYRSTDGGATWAAAANPPPISAVSGQGWQAGRLYWNPNGHLYLSIYGVDGVAPYKRHDQLWVSVDQGQNWSRLRNAPDRPVVGLAVGPSTLGGAQETIYLSTQDSNEIDEYPIAPDLFLSRDSGATWLNLGAAPSGGAKLLAPVDAADRVWAGGRGVWLLEAAQMPTATPDLATEILFNGSFEYEGYWRIPETAYSAGYSQEKHFAGYWSMRSGIVIPAHNVRSYSDFSQDVSLPISNTITLRLHRWPSSGASLQAAAAPVILPAAADLDEFQRLVEAAGGDLQYVLLIQNVGQPNSKINYLYTGLDNQQAWVEQRFDLSAYTGQTVRLQFGTFNNGTGPLAVQYFDALSVQAVRPAPTPEPPGPFRLWMPHIRTEGGTIPPAP